MKDNNQLLNAISYSRIHKGYLTTAEIILVHQHMQQGVQLSDKISNKINIITKQIKTTKWQRPITRINTQLQLEQLHNGVWLTVK